MNPLEDLLQARLERLEAREPLETCLAGLPEQEAELLKLAAGLRQVPYPARDRALVAAQRRQLLRLAEKEKAMSTKAPRSSLWSDILGRLRAHPWLVASAATAALLLCVLVSLLAANLARPASPESQPVVSQPDESIFTVFMPAVPAPDIRDPQHASLKNIQGLVQVQGEDGAWITVENKYHLGAGERIRTGPLSSAVLALYDGSRVHLGPDTDVSLDKLNAPLGGGARVVALTQTLGETQHQVAPSDHPNASYTVRTPAGLAQAKGTVFQVRIDPNRLARFDVDEGAVTVTNQETTVLVEAGQSSTVQKDQAPEEPVFRISGEGEVTQTGEVWIIADQSFQTHDATVVVGNPQVGDWVRVEGRITGDDARIADLIVLLQDSPENQFSLNGPVEAMDEGTWTVAGQAISLTAETEIEPGIEIGDLVRVEGHILPGGGLVTEQIHRLETSPGTPFEFVGVVQHIGDESWGVSGVEVGVDDETEIDERLAEGDLVKVEGWILDDGTWLATEIKRELDEERKFEFSGEVESIDPWVVAGIPFETREWTEIEAGIEVGDRVEVEGQILPDGTWVAAEIELEDAESDPTLQFVFVGVVEEIEPWVVSGFSLTVDAETEIVGDIVVGDLVKVEIEILPDGTWRTQRISLLEFDSGLGCLVFSALVIEVGDGRLELPGWPPIDLNGVQIEGELEANSVVLVLICIDQEGNLVIVSIIVIRGGEEIIVPGPPDDDDGEKVTICHKPNGNNPHTITIDRSALQAHLDHGDSLGPCPNGDDDD